MLEIDYTNTTYHAQYHRGDRFNFIENTIGWGKPVAIAPDKDDPTATATLTDTGVIIIRSQYNSIITAYIARTAQASGVWWRAKGKNVKMSQKLWNTINYNNNTEYWKRISGLN